MAVPYTFGTATSSIPLSQLDSNFNTAITLGNTAIQLGNTATTLNNMTLANVTIASGNVTLTNVTVTTANVTTANITTAVIVNDNVTNLVATSANVTTANVTTANITTDNITNGTVSGSLTLSGGTANGVAYLNGSKVVTTGSALTYNGVGLGIGVASATQLLNLSGAGTSNIQLVSTDSGGKNLLISVSGSLVNLNELNGNPIAFGIGNSEQMRLTSTGLGIGTSSPLTKLQIGSGGGTGVKDVFYIGSYSTDTSQFRLLWNHVGLGTLGIGTANDTSGSMIFGRASDTAGTVGAEWMRLDTSGNLGLGVTPSAWVGINAVQVGTLGALSSNISAGTVLSNNAYATSAGWAAKYITTGTASFYEQIGGAHYWLSAPSGTAGDAITFTQAMTLDASGNLLVGQTTHGFVNANSFEISPPNGGYTISNHVSGSTSGTAYAYFAYNAGVIGSITQSGTTAVLYNITSDQRLKENIVDAPEFGSVIDSMQVRSYDWKSDGNHQRAGFIAQELVTVAPEAVHQPADPEEMMAVDYSKLVPMLVKEIQSLRARVAQLESK